MAVLKYHDGTGWEPVVSALQGPTGAAGAVYQTTAPTDTGVLWIDTDDDGHLVVPNGGVTGSVLTKSSSADYDTEWNVPTSTGLVHINTTTFTTSSSESFNDVFSATYDNYRLIFAGLTSVDGAYVGGRFRVAGADNSTANYYTQISRAFSTTANGLVAASGGTSFGDLFQGKPNGCHFSIDIYNPFATKNSAITGIGGRDNNIHLVSHQFQATTSFTGISLFPTSGTMTGSVSIFGYAKA